MVSVVPLDRSKMIVKGAMRVASLPLLLILSCFSTTIAYAQNGDVPSVELRAARVCSGIAHVDLRSQGSLSIEGLVITGTPNGTLNINKDGVDLGAIQPGTYQEYTACLMAMTRMLLQPIADLPANGTDTQRGGAESIDLTNQTYEYDEILDSSDRERSHKKIPFHLASRCNATIYHPEEVGVEMFVAIELPTGAAIYRSILGRQSLIVTRVLPAGSYVLHLYARRNYAGLFRGSITFDCRT